MSRRRAGQGALFVVAMLFASSGALRLGSGIGAAQQPPAKCQPPYPTR
jgi:hypothetical protein